MELKQEASDLAKEWRNGNRDSVIEEIVNNDSATAAYLAIAIGFHLDSVSRFSLQETIEQRIRQEIYNAAYQVCSNAYVDPEINLNGSFAITSKNDRTIGILWNIQDSAYKESPIQPITFITYQEAQDWINNGCKVERGSIVFGKSPEQIRQNLAALNRSVEQAQRS